MAIAIASFATGTATTTNATSYTGTAGTPTAGDLLINFVLVSDSTTPGTMSGTFTWNRLNLSTLKNSSLDMIEAFWAYAATATSTTPVYTTGGGVTASGCLMQCVRITGAEGQTQPYFRQTTTATGSSTNPTVVFGSAPLTGNGLIIFGADTGANTTTQWTSPTGFSQISKNTYNTPANSAQISYANSGITNATISFTNTNNSSWAAMCVELYVAGTGPTPESSSADYFGGISSI